MKAQNMFRREGLSRKLAIDLAISYRVEQSDHCWIQAIEIQSPAFWPFGDMEQDFFLVGISLKHFNK